MTADRPARVIIRDAAILDATVESSGGSAYGLDTASGVMRYLEAHGRGFDVGVAVVPIVPAAVIVVRQKKMRELQRPFWMANQTLPK